ncbi:MAG: aldo/keto reductase [Chloroflexi bacterium]|nr:aldo/keto reductase [Chloroflexota bacterium]
MEYRPLGNSGLQVSLAGLGTNSFGRRCDGAQSVAVVHRSMDLGITFFDTADIYGDGLSEEYIGNAVQGRRHEVILATKFESAIGDGPLRRGASRRHMMHAVHASLQRLKTDYIDLYQIHFWDPTTPLEETMRALDDLVTHGDVRYIGCSNFAAWQVVEAQWIARSEHIEPLIAAQNAFSLLNRSIEAELVPVCERYGLGVIPYSPLAGGFLTGKYRSGQPPPAGSRLATSGERAPRTLNEANFATLAKLERFASERDHTVGELALAWLGSQSAVGSVIAGATRPEQVDENVRSLEWRLSGDDTNALDALLAG